MVPPQVDTEFIINLPFWAPYGLECMVQLSRDNIKIKSQHAFKKVLDLVESENTQNSEVNFNFPL